MIELVALEKIFSLGEPGALVGDGTIPYPGNRRVLEAPEVAETVKETRLGKTKLLLGEAAVLGTSGMLEIAVCSEIPDTVFVKRMDERPPVPITSAAEGVKMDGGVDDGCDKE